MRKRESGMGDSSETDKKKLQAVALGYDRQSMQAPRILATGKGRVAEKMLEKAQEHKIPVQRDPVLAEALGQLDLGQEIPPELYKVVAEVLAFIMQTDRQYKQKLK